ncbi:MULTISPECIES: MBL fold metallo-hydrolase [Stenotrophomonas]|uniref:MBL fold metallo-hydrolase n=1 Tax=Stenotrophomonas TaxID=40323 RepID=UPI001CF3083C|nr:MULTISPECIES: MBL fold metallo-hydrolase [Stenotrophomonas]MCA7024135.1 MBL fold metallo-hydrolase [Stenotrophomonas acidaminiphila]MCE4074886.1 MBL fold metallo-hydrolase [Stenotrophomonas acidaminiphila]
MATLEWRLYEAGHCTHPELATRRGASPRACEFPALVTLLRHPEHGRILFDTGYSGHFLDATARFPERLYRLVTPVNLSPCESLAAQLHRDGVAPEDIGWVVVSHLHGDHVGGLADFAGARVACSRAAWDDLHGRSRLGALRVGLLPSLLERQQHASLHWFEDRPARELQPPFDHFGHGYDLFGDASLLLVPLPGHAAGHFGALFDDGNGPVFLVADASWSSQAIRDNAPPPALVTGWLGDTTAYRDTLARLHDLHRTTPRLRIVPSHCHEWRPRRERQR